MPQELNSEDGKSVPGHVASTDPVRRLTWMPVHGHPMAIRAALLDARQAMVNHAQTLEQLADRGGLSLDEAAAVASRRRWRSMTTDEAMAELKAVADRCRWNPDT